MSIPLTTTLKSTAPRICHFVSLWRRSAFRGLALRSKCAPYDDAKCSKETLQKAFPSKIQRLEKKEKMAQTNSMWENPCPDYFSRFDEVYYKTSDKRKRKYQQTWISCPKLQVKPKKISIHDHLKLPSLEKRPRKKRPQTACPIGVPRICMDNKSKKCPRLMMPGCRGAQQPPKCKRERSPVTCLKECTPYPSYSECLRINRDPPHPTECMCLNHPMMCEVWAEMRRRMTFVKG